MFGISVYLSDIDYDYIDYAYQMGARYVFTSLHIPEESLVDLSEVLPDFLTYCQRKELPVICDISPYTFTKLNLENGDFKGLKAYGFSLMRLDFGFEAIDQVKTISEHFDLVLNASLVDDHYLEVLKNAGVKLEGIYLMHNFYPKSDTGLSERYFSDLCLKQKGYGLATMAFVVGDYRKRLPLFEGLPTLEKHRDTHPFIASLEFIMDYGIDHVIIGDNQAKHSTLKMLSDFLNHGVISLVADLDDEFAYLYDQEISIRQDNSVDLIRLAIDRIPNVAIRTNNHRRQGAIIMSNKLAGRYSGEIQIVKHNLSYQARENNIGYIHSDFIKALEYVDNHVKIKLVRSSS